MWTSRVASRSYAAFRVSTAAARARKHPEYVNTHHLLFEAAKRNRADVAALLLDLGTPVNVQDSSRRTALHEAAASGALAAARFLIDCGAEVDAKESTYGSTPIGWAAHGDRAEMVHLLARHSRDIWTLCFHGFVDRVRAILADDPGLARVAAANGRTPLWWLPDDEERAMAVVEALLAAGADPSTANQQGQTAADWARRRGMVRVAARLETADWSDERP